MLQLKFAWGITTWFLEMLLLRAIIAPMYNLILPLLALPITYLTGHLVYNLVYIGICLVYLLVCVLEISYCVWKGRKTLHKPFKFIDNIESGYHNEGMHTTYEEHLKTGDGQELKDYLAKGYSKLQYSLHWTIVRNPVNYMQETVMAYKLREMDEVVYSKTTLDEFHGRVADGYWIKGYHSPTPQRIRKAMKLGHPSTYLDIELIRFGWIYCPLFRWVVIHDDTYHSEYIIGYKNYNYKVTFVANGDLGNVDIVNDNLAQTATVNRAYKREDKDWA